MDGYHVNCWPLLLAFVLRRQFIVAIISSNHYFLNTVGWNWTYNSWQYRFHQVLKGYVPKFIGFPKNQSLSRKPNKRGWIFEWNFFFLFCKCLFFHTNSLTFKLVAALQFDWHVSFSPECMTSQAVNTIDLLTRLQF